MEKGACYLKAKVTTNSGDCSIYQVRDGPIILLLLQTFFENKASEF